MANNKAKKLEESSLELRERLARWALGILVAAGIGWLALTIWRRPPQMGASEDTFKTVDALYTAVTGKNQVRLAQCERRLAALKEKGELPNAAANALTSIIAQAKAGDWQPAAAQLYTFMLAQRRDGAGEHDKHHEKKSAKKGDPAVAAVR